MSLPVIGMFYGLQECTAYHTNGLVDARFIAVVDTALESPQGQIVTPADYSELGLLLVTVTGIGLFLPILTILLVNCKKDPR